jgi:ATP-dependent RNA helicase DeaD
VRSPYYKDAQDINAPLGRSRNEERGKKRSGKEQVNISQGKSRRLFINAGALDDLTKKSLVKSICSISGISSQKIGAIEIMREFSFVDVDAGVAERVVNSMKGAELDGREINMEFAEKKKGKDRDPSKGKKKKR